MLAAGVRLRWCSGASITLPRSSIPSDDSFRDRFLPDRASALAELAQRALEPTGRYVSTAMSPGRRTGRSDTV